MIFIHNTPQIQTSVRQPIIENPQATDNNPIDQVVQELPEITEQPIEQHVPQENIDTTLRRSTKAKKSVVYSDYVVYLQESDYNISAENDLKVFTSHV